MSKGITPTGKQKHIPQRTCVVCRETSAKRALVRIVRTVEEGVQVDPTGKRNGRGAYLCHQQSCWKRAIETEILEKALRTTLTADDKQRLNEAMVQMIGASE
jgi:predicted RNA-binding protein YlxR (DUF448 family)